MIRHTVASGKGLEYETWLREIVPIAVTASGHRGVLVIPMPGVTLGNALI